MTTFEPGLVEGQTLDGPHTVDCDVCIIGSGPGGSISAATLAARGLRVVVLEAGGYFTKERFRMREDEAFPSLYQDGGQRATKDLAIGIYQGKAVGGGTAVNWTTCFRTPHHVVDLWRERFAVAGVSNADLAPHFDLVEERLGIAPIPAAMMNRNNRLLFDGCQALGFSPHTLKRNVRGCAHTGYCGMGCPIDAKQSTFLTTLPDAMNAGATVFSRCRADRLDVSQGRVGKLFASFQDATGRRETGATLVVTAKRFIASGGALNTPALFLRSGLVDPHGRLGQRTFLHPVVSAASFYDEPVHPYHGAPQSAACHHFAERDAEVGFFLEAAPAHPALAATTLPGFGRAHRTLMKKLPFVAAHLAITIDGFHDDVKGGTVSVDKSGRPVLDYPITERHWRAFREGHKVLARVNFEMGATRIVTGHDPVKFLKPGVDVDAAIDALPYAPNKVFMASAHQMGGAGMSDDPKRGVVRSEDLRHHQIENLHVIDGSVFPTSLGVNPQESIFGLASLISSRIAQNWS